MTKFGFELEVRNNAGGVIADLHAQGLTALDYFHSYHCECEVCDYSTEQYAFFGQEDCTVEGELISTIHQYGTERHFASVDAISAALTRTSADITGNTGCHVHVENDGLGGRYGEGQIRLVRLFTRYAGELQEIAAGGQQDIRGYNGVAPSMQSRDHRRNRSWYGDGDQPEFRWCNPQSRPAHVGNWLSEKSHTNEFRLWNATRAAWRINLYVGLSVAITRAALDGVETAGPSDTRPVEAVLAPYLDDTTWAGILRQRFLKGGVSA